MLKSYSQMSHPFIYFIGLIVGDMGEKLGLNGMDNGFMVIIFAFIYFIKSTIMFTKSDV